VVSRAGTAPAHRGRAGGQVAGDHAQEVVGVAEEPLRQQDLRDGGDGQLEGVDRVVVARFSGVAMVVVGLLLLAEQLAG
jgi:hypothetical protein